MIEQSFMKALFHGVIAEDLIYPFPEPLAEERDSVRMMLDSVRRFAAQHIDSAKIDEAQELPEAVLSGLKELGLFGLQIEQPYGGLGLSTMSYARVMEEIGGIDGSIAVTLGAHQGIGLKGLLLFGNDEQKQKYLPRLASGEQVAAFALTEPGAGSDAAAIQTRADISPDGRHYVLNGSKIWITNGAFADVFTVFARTSRAEEGTKPRLTAFLVERGMGVKSGPNEHKLGIRGSSTTALYFDDVRVPVENVLGEPGRGFKVAMEVLNTGRLSLATGCLGMVKRLLKMSIERVQERKAFGRSIGQFGLIKDKIAQMSSQAWALESAAYLTAGLVDARIVDYSLESAICKVVGSETLWRVVDDALQIAAGIGYMKEYPYERLLRDSRINMIFEGTNEILRCFIALSGMAGPGKELSDVARAVREPIKGFGLLSDFAIRKARTALGRERMTRAHPILSREAVMFEEYTGELAKNVDKMLRKHGKDITEMQFTQKRVAELAMDLYCVAACIARTTRAIERRGEEGARREIDLTTMFAAAAERRMSDIVRSFERNDDELRKVIAGRAYTDGGYPFDILLSKYLVMRFRLMAPSLLGSAALLGLSCASSSPRQSEPEPPREARSQADSPVERRVEEGEQTRATAAEGEEEVESPCPEDMLFVDGSYCAEVERECLKKERNKANHITLCHRFAQETRCTASEEKRTFCIDKYEYPNREGAHPAWMVSWYDAQATCASMGKRLCYESEWVTACEGPERTPFPYGWERDQTACNIDNTWISPRLGRLYSRDAATSSEELERLDQSRPSGAMARCVSGYGVSDMTGNFDEWVTSDQPPGPRDKSKWAGLKGGAWGHVRNACRPMTTSHAPEFTYYFISFRCCADAKGYPAYQPTTGRQAPQVEPRDRAPVPIVKNPAGPSARKVQPEN